MNMLGYETRRLGLNRIGDNSIKQNFYFIFIYGNKSSDRKTKPSVRREENSLWLGFDKKRYNPRFYPTSQSTKGRGVR